VAFQTSAATEAIEVSVRAEYVQTPVGIRAIDAPRVDEAELTEEIIGAETPEILLLSELEALSIRSEIFLSVSLILLLKIVRALLMAVLSVLYSDDEAVARAESTCPFTFVVIVPGRAARLPPSELEALVVKKPRVEYREEEAERTLPVITL
jgi:hypothetical protein